MYNVVVAVVIPFNTILAINNNNNSNKMIIITRQDNKAMQCMKDKNWQKRKPAKQGTATKTDIITEQTPLHTETVQSKQFY